MENAYLGRETYTYARENAGTEGSTGEDYFSALPQELIEIGIFATENAGTEGSTGEDYFSALPQELIEEIVLEVRFRS